MFKSIRLASEGRGEDVRELDPDECLDRSRAIKRSEAEQLKRRASNEYCL
jgi:hypothetical protein